MLLYVKDRQPRDAIITSDMEGEPPVWPPSLADYLTEGLKYDLRIVPMSSIAVVTSIVQKVDASRIVDGISKSAMTTALEGAAEIIEQLRPDLLAREAELTKIRSMEFVELLQERRSLLKQREAVDVTAMADFEEQVSNLSSAASPRGCCLTVSRSPSRSIARFTATGSSKRRSPPCDKPSRNRIWNYYQTTNSASEFCRTCSSWTSNRPSY
jgi:hypothetical protein